MTVYNDGVGTPYCLLSNLTHIIRLDAACFDCA
jgi:hypothetical protein